MAPSMIALRDLAVTVAVGALGAGLFSLIGFPIAPLTGAAVAVSVACVAGLPIGVPDWLRNLTFTTLGINIGSSVTPDFLQTLVAWPVSFLILAVMVISVIYACRAMLQYGFGFDRDTATLCAIPGHLSYALGLAAEGKRDIITVTVVSSTRVLLLTVCVPPVIDFVFGATELTFLPPTELDLTDAFGLYLLAAGLGYVLVRLEVPAAYLLGGMAVSATGHLSEITPGRLPDELVTLALLMMGAIIGSRFLGTSFGRLWAGVFAGVAVTVVMLTFAILGAAMVTAILGLPLGLMVVAFAPGGVEAMAAIAMQLGLDPPFVAGHHVFRLVLLTFLVPLLLRGPPRPRV